MQEKVKSYIKSDGTHVSGYTRNITARDRAVDSVNGRKAKGSTWKEKRERVKA